MKFNNKLETIAILFEGKKIRSIWDNDIEDYYFSVTDIIIALTGTNRPRKYWNDLKKKLVIEGSQLSENIGQLKMKSSDGKYYNTDVLDTKGILRLIESIPSAKAEPFKIWLANLGNERIDEVFNPEIAINRAIEYYHKKGYPDEWIKMRIDSILNRKKLTQVWKEGGIEKNYEYALLTDEIYKTWSGMSAKEYKDFKHLKKEALRDNMSDIEVALTNLSEITTRDIAASKKPIGLKENLIIAKKGGYASKLAKEYYEEETGNSALSNQNNKILR